MCGLFGGMSRYLSSNEIDAIRALGAVSVVRGDHSTGIGVCHSVKKRKGGSGPRLFSVLKDTIDPYGLLYHSDLHDFFKSINNPNCIIGHCRQATIGEVSVENAHPYEFSDIIGAHNGTISKFADKQKGTTDSYHLYSLINEHGIKKVVQEMLPIEGAYALTWINKKENTLNMLRNEMRPLFLAKAAGGNTIFWASDPAILNLVHRHEQVHMETPEMVPANVLHTWSIGSPQVCSRIELEVPKPLAVITPLKNQQCSSVPYVPFQGRPSAINNFSELARDLEEKTKEANKEDENPFIQQNPLLIKDHTKSGPSTTTGTASTTTTSTISESTTSKSTTNQPLRTVFPYLDTVTENSMDSAVFLYGHNLPSSSYPRFIQCHDGKNKSIFTSKFLRYRMPDGKLLPREQIDMYLLAGCAACGAVPDEPSDVRWLNNEGEFVLKAFYDGDDFYKTYSSYKEKLAAGRYVYASLSVIKALEEFNK